MNLNSNEYLCVNNLVESTQNTHLLQNTKKFKYELIGKVNYYFGWNKRLAKPNLLYSCSIQFNFNFSIWWICFAWQHMWCGIYWNSFVGFFLLFDKVYKLSLRFQLFWVEKLVNSGASIDKNRSIIIFFFGKMLLHSGHASLARVKICEYLTKVVQIGCLLI